MFLRSEFSVMGLLDRREKPPMTKFAAKLKVHNWIGLSATGGPRAAPGVPVLALRR
jgi:hypothetical protein